MFAVTNGPKRYIAPHTPHTPHQARPLGGLPPPALLHQQGEQEQRNGRAPAVRVSCAERVLQAGLQLLLGLRRTCARLWQRLFGTAAPAMAVAPPAKPSTAAGHAGARAQAQRRDAQAELAQLQQRCDKWQNKVDALLARRDRHACVRGPWPKDVDPLDFARATHASLLEQRAALQQRLAAIL